MTVAALAAGAAWWGITAAVVADVAVVAGTAMSIASSYQQADAAADSARVQAQAAAQQYQAQAEAYAQQAAENEMLAKVENEKAGIAQVQGEQEAETRSRALASEIGGIDAGFAGNGLLVDGDDDGDTFANVLKSSTVEAQHDITTIKDNTAISVWDHQMNRRAYLANASILSTASRNAMISAQTALKVGEAQAAAAQAGTNLNAVGKGLSAAGTLAGMGVSSYSTFAKMAPTAGGAAGGATNMGSALNNAYDWDGPKFAYGMA